MGRIGPTEIIIVAVLIIVIFGWKKLPDAARSLGRSARVFKSEVDEMKKENEASKSEASTTTVRTEPSSRPPAPTAPCPRPRATPCARTPRARTTSPARWPERSSTLLLPLHGRLRRTPSRPRGPDDLGEHFREFRRRPVHRRGVGARRVDRGGHLLRPRSSRSCRSRSTTTGARTRRARSASTSVRPRRRCPTSSACRSSSASWRPARSGSTSSGLHRPGADPQGEADLAGLPRRDDPALHRRLLPRVPHPPAVAGDPVRVQPRGTRTSSRCRCTSFVTRFILVFGLGFLFPVASWASTSSGSCRRRGSSAAGGSRWSSSSCSQLWATPTADPFTMFVFAAPLTAPTSSPRGSVRRVLDKRKAKARARLARRRRHRGLPALTGPRPGDDPTAAVSPGRRGPGR